MTASCLLKPSKPVAWIIVGILITFYLILYSTFYLELVEPFLLGLFYDRKLVTEYLKIRNQKSSSSSLLINQISEISPFDRFNNNTSIKMDDPALVDTVKKLLFPPSLLPYKLNNMKYVSSDYNPSVGQTQAVADILKRLGGDGFYVECGGYNGELASNTFWIERALGWKGLLIEPNPSDFAKLQAKHRNAWSGNFCISNLIFPSKVLLYQSYPSMAGILKIKNRFYQSNSRAVMVQCIPLYTILLAVNRTTVDFFSLDVEGSELNILRTVPFDKVMFKVITVEHLAIKEGREGLQGFMESKGYVLYKTITDLNKYGRTDDSIFLHKSVASQLKPKEKRRMKERARQPETGRPRELTTRTPPKTESDHKAI